MKYFIYLTLACTMVFALAGCDQNVISPTIATVISTEETADTKPAVEPMESQIPETSEEAIPGIEEEQKFPTEGDEVTTEPVHDHSYTSKVTKSPTCTNSGVITYTCKECGDSYSTILDPLDHAYVITKKEPDCVNSGGTTYHCAVCKHTYTDNIKPALGHTYGPMVTVRKPTELLPGLGEHTCTRCGEIEKVELPKLTSES